MAFIMVVLAGFLGILAHWFNRWVDGRSESTFFEYISAYKKRTISSAISVFASSAAAYEVMPPDLTLMAFLSSFSAGYMLDSVINKDKPVATKVIATDKVAEVKNAQDAKSLDDVLRDDRAL